MLRFGRSVRCTSRIARAGAITGSVSLAALLAAGCSADIARFDSPLFALNDSSSVTGSLTPSEGMQVGARFSEPSPRDGASAYAAPSGLRQERVESANLPDPAAAPPPPTTRLQPSPPLSSARVAPPRGPMGREEIIEVRPGDTLYGIARRHNVSVAELMSVNQLASPTIRPGQHLALPGGTRVPAMTTPSASRQAKAPVAAPAPATTPAPLAGASSYTVKAGDSLYEIARHHGVRLADLQRANGITDPRRVRAGTVLAIPGADTVAAAPAVRDEAPQPEPRSAAVPLSTRPVVINAERQVAALDRGATATDATATTNDAVHVAAPSKGADGVDQAGPASAALKFRWPAKGKIISNFGPRPDGTHNDGIDIAVPLGVEVLAAEAGVVAYAGNELKGFGNLILIRHDNGWVTAYAHNDELLVKRGDRIRRGQPVAKAGKTGQVEQPTVHFEIRSGSKPVDPMPYLERT